MTEDEASPGAGIEVFDEHDEYREIRDNLALFFPLLYDPNNPFRRALERSKAMASPQAEHIIKFFDQHEIDPERLAIVNGEYRSSLLTRPSDGRRPDLTPEGEKRMEEYRAFRDQFGTYDHPEVRPLGERCIMSFGSSAGPPMLPNSF